MKRHLSSILLLILVHSLSGQLAINDQALKKAKIVNQDQINTNGLEFSPFIYRDFVGIVYSNEKSGRDNRINEFFFDLAFVGQNTDHTLVKKAAFNANINTPFHEGPAAFDPINGRLYFTRTSMDEDAINIDTFTRKIYVAEEYDNFARIQPLSINSNQYSVCHPTLTKNGLNIIYSSDIGKSGNMDLYFNKLGNPQGIALYQLNSDANEVFPFLYRDSVLFFASDREGGYGGLDIYASIKSKDDWGTPTLLPQPINSEYDDFGLILFDDNKNGYLTSNRLGGKGKDDIYLVNSEEPIIIKKQPIKVLDFTFSLLDKLTLNPLPGIDINIAQLDIKKLTETQLNQVDIVQGSSSDGLLMKIPPAAIDNEETITTSSEGTFQKTLITNSRYIISIKLPDYEPQNVILNPNETESDVTIILNPKPKNIENEPNTDIIIPIEKNKVVVFNNIYYERNSAAIQDGASIELDALARAMLENPTMEVELSAHTDSRGTSAYNNELSLQRASSAKNYLMSKGIQQNRVKAIGYGESQIRNQCLDGVKCTEEEHRYNRRTEVKIINI